MIKGINRQIIEILDTGNPYFERALLVVQSGIDADANALRREAQDVLAAADECSHLQRARRRFILSYVLSGFACAIFGAVIALFCVMI